MSPLPIHAVTFGRAALGLPGHDIQAAFRFYSEILCMQKVLKNGSTLGFILLKKDAAEIHLAFVFADLDGNRVDVGERICSRINSGRRRILEAA